MAQVSTIVICQCTANVAVMYLKFSITYGYNLSAPFMLCSIRELRAFLLQSIITVEIALKVDSEGESLHPYFIGAAHTSGNRS